MNKPDVAPTVETIREAAEVMRRAADQLDHCAQKVVETGDLSRAAEAVETITKATMQARLDLLVTRPIRALRHEIDDLKA